MNLPRQLSRSVAVAALSIIAASLGVVSCSDEGQLGPSVAAPSAGPSYSTAPGPVTLVGAGNIAKCAKPGDDATAALLDGIPGTVFTLGDAAYDNGTPTQYTTCYGPSWGRHKGRTQPTPSDRDYKTAGAAGYFGYFGAAAGDPAKGYYSYDLGAWHVVVLNSGSTAISMAAGSPQEQWLRADLDAHPALCTIAYWHHPLFDSKDAPNTKVRPLWDALYAAGVDVVVNAHYAFYERFAPQTPAGIADPVNGIREFVVGTGGAENQNPDHLRANSEVRNGTTWGVLKLTLNAAGYDWQFIPVAGKTFTDAGTASCHDVATANHAPTAAAGGPYAGPATQPIAFDGRASSDPDGDALTYAWNFGDGTTGTGATPSHVYATEGSYTVTLTVRDSRGAASAAATTTATIGVAASVLLAAGDIASCGITHDELTAQILDSIPGTVMPLGDNAFPDGTLTSYQNCYGPSWGRHLARSYAVLGNHEYNTGAADGAFDYFGDRAGPRGLGYYSFNVGTWHIIVLNSNRNFVSVSAGSPQDQWLQADLAANTSKCTLAAFHHPRFLSSFDPGFFSSGPMKNFWDRLYAAGADVVLNAQMHHYERFLPQTPSGLVDTDFGITEFMVGTGGESTSLPTEIAPNSAVQSDAFGVLKLTLYPDRYTWEFKPMEGETFTDSGSGTCHDAPGTVNRPPNAAPGGPYSGVEGAAVTFDGSGSTDLDADPLTYAWTFGDGTSGTGRNPTHVYADNGSYTVTLTVTDARGATGAPASTTAIIANAAPVVSAGADQAVTVGTPVTLNAAFSDGVNDAPWGYTVDWGDGSSTTGTTSNQTAPITASHTYAAAGTNTVRVSVADKDGGLGAGQLTVTVGTAPVSVTLAGAGNIARCNQTGDEATAALLDGIPGTVMSLGDAAFPGGTPSAYQDCYAPSWGRHKTRTTPVPGNREYDSSATAAGYFGYWGAQAGDPTQGYYSYDAGAWHIIVLNSNNAFVSTAVGSPQETWLRADLAATTKQCVLALFHHPRFYSTTSATFSPTGSVKPFWDDLYAANAELIVNAHMRDYERFAPQTPTGAADPVNGIREIIAGTGGEGLDLPNTLIIPNSEVNISGVFGVLKLTLDDGSYSWQFVPVAGQTATDSGSGVCH